MILRNTQFEDKNCPSPDREEGEWHRLGRKRKKEEERKSKKKKEGARKRKKEQEGLRRRNRKKEEEISPLSRGARVKNQSTK